MTGSEYSSQTGDNLLTESRRTPLPTFIHYKCAVNCSTPSVPTVAFSHLEILLPTKKKLHLVIAFVKLSFLDNAIFS